MLYELKDNCYLLGSQLCFVVLSYSFIVNFSNNGFGYLKPQSIESANTVCMFTFTEINSIEEFDLSEAVL